MPLWTHYSIAVRKEPTRKDIFKCELVHPHPECHWDNPSELSEIVPVGKDRGFVAKFTVWATSQTLFWQFCCKYLSVIQNTLVPFNVIHYPCALAFVPFCLNLLHLPMHVWFPYKPYLSFSKVHSSFSLLNQRLKSWSQKKEHAPSGWLLFWFYYCSQ